MSESITHTAVVDDCLRMVMVSDRICLPFKEAFSNNIEIARLAGNTRHGDRHNPALLDKYSKQWHTKGADKQLYQKLAFILGWMSHRAADRIMKRVFRKYDPDCTQKPTDCSIYCDICVLREIYRAHHDDGINPAYTPQKIQTSLRSHPAAEGAGVDAIEDMLQSMWQRMLLKMHTFIPDDNNPEKWIEEVIRKHQRLYVDIQRYAEAWSRPEKDKTDRFIIKSGFYNPEDKLIKTVRSIQSGIKVNPEMLTQAITDEQQASLYSQILRKGYQYLQASSQFFENRIERAEMEKLMDIGMPEY